MLTIEIFRERATALWNSQKAMAAPKKFKSGRRAGAVRRQALPIAFTKDELAQWLWKRVGLNAVSCPYCKVPIDIISLTLDHIHPRSAGGDFSLENMQCICVDDNHRKGNLTHDAYLKVLRFTDSELSPYDRGILLARLKASHHGSGSRFFRDKAAAERKAFPPSKPAQQNPMDFDLGAF